MNNVKIEKKTQNTMNVLSTNYPEHTFLCYYRICLPSRSFCKTGIVIIYIMMLQFSIENFLSFKQKAILDCKAGSIKEFPENLFDPVFNTDLKLLKSLGIYGANSSGKSNLIKAFSFMKSFVINSFKESQSNEQIPFQPFKLTTDAKDKPSTFEVVFLIDDVRYKYGFSINNKSVESEWLFQTIKRKEEYVFLRVGKDFTIQKSFKSDLKGKLDVLTEFTRLNSLFLSVIAAHNIALATQLINWFGRVIVIKDSDHLELINFSAQIMSYGNYRELINDIVQRSGLGIDSVEERVNEISSKRNFSSDFIAFLFQDEPKDYRVRTRHKIFTPDKRIANSEYFDLIDNESSGSQKFFGLLGPILLALKEKRIIFIDELDSKIHTKLLEMIVGIFNSEKYNRKGAQLVFTSHNTHILKNKFRRDQMLLIDKDEYGESTLGSVHKNFRRVRNDASFDKDYLLGEYKAIPKINITQLDLFKDE
jgi:AAA15 family ATPase/GTPase